MNNLLNLSNLIKFLSLSAIEKANSGHPGMVMGIAEVVTILFRDFIVFNPNDPKWINRDRFILSAGHGSMLLYSVLYLTGYKDIDMQDIKSFRQLNSKAAGHPEYGMLDGIETTTGPLGQGIANAVGMAIAQKLSEAKYGEELFSNYTYVLAGDGCLMEGISQEAISLAGHLQLNKLILIYDANDISIDGPIDLTFSEDVKLRFEACNWDVQEVSGYDEISIQNALKYAKQSVKPSLIICKTQIGRGANKKAGSEKSHGAPLGKEEIDYCKKHYNWQYEDFELPEDNLQEWRNFWLRNESVYNEWQKNFNSNLNKEKIFNHYVKGEYFDEKSLDLFIDEFKSDLLKQNINEATRQSSGNIIEFLHEKLDMLIGGSADLSGSNNVKDPKSRIVSANNFLANYIHYGVREHAMCSIMNGMSLYKGFIPFGGTFLVFMDYCKPAIRLSALMQQKVIYIFTHDSIGVGEDGPTHQPIEHLSNLRSIPEMQTFRPADVIETLESWQIALKSNGPSAIILTRQKVKQIRKDKLENMSSKGAYIVSESEDQEKLDFTIFASGSEVNLALDVKNMLPQFNIRVVSVVSFELFRQQPKDYVDSLLNNDSQKIAIEAASKFGWQEIIGREGRFFGVEEFGRSGKAEDLYEFFGLTAKIIAEKITLLKNK